MTTSERSQTTLVLTAEWVLTLFRWAVLAVFAVMVVAMPSSASMDPLPLFMVILCGITYNLFVAFSLIKGLAAREPSRLGAFFLVADVLLVSALVRYSGLYACGLLLPFLIIAVMVSLRATLRTGLLIGAALSLGYLLFSRLLPAAYDGFWHTVSDIASLMLAAAACGWFAEGTSRPWAFLEDLGRRLSMVDDDRDETARQLEMYKKMEENRRDFLAVMSHELRTPLTGIIGFTDLLLMEELDPLSDRQKEAVAEILGQSQDLLALIDNLLNLSRIQSGRWDLRLEKVDPHLLLLKVVAVMSVHVRKKGICLVHVPPETPLPPVSLDREKVERALLNLLGNALKYTPPGGRVEVSAELGVDDSLALYFSHLVSSTQVVRFTITDSGPSIAARDRPHIFEKFYRGTQGDRRHATGAGLGLSIVKEIIDLHWGRVWHESVLGGGNAFHITLPVSPVRLQNRIALVKQPFTLEPLFQGLLVQFKEEIDAKNLTVQRRGWPFEEHRAGTILGDRQLLQAVFFNILQNQIRYAFPSTKLLVATTVDRRARLMTVTIENEGEILDEETLEELRERSPRAAETESPDLRRVNVNLHLAQDILASHGGSLSIDPRPGGLAFTVHIPLEATTTTTEVPHVTEANLDRRG